MARLKLENIEVPLGTIKPFMEAWDKDWCGDNDCESDFELSVKYPPIDYDGEIVWEEMSYYQFKDTCTCYRYDYYANGSWCDEEECR